MQCHFIAVLTVLAQFQTLGTDLFVFVSGIVSGQTLGAG
jgi:hypothetical protein